MTTLIRLKANYAHLTVADKKVHLFYSYPSKSSKVSPDR